MGKAVPKNVKSRANLLLKERIELFSEDFAKNKQAINALALPFSKTVRNLVAGYITGEMLKKTKRERKEKAFSEKQAARLAA